MKFLRSRLNSTDFKLAPWPCCYLHVEGNRFFFNKPDNEICVLVLFGEPEGKFTRWAVLNWNFSWYETNRSTIFDISEIFEFSCVKAADFYYLLDAEHNWIGSFFKSFFPIFRIIFLFFLCSPVGVSANTGWGNILRACERLGILNKVVTR